MSKCTHTHVTSVYVCEYIYIPLNIYTYHVNSTYKYANIYTPTCKFGMYIRTYIARLHKNVSARLHKNVSCMQYTNKFAPRSAASWVAWRAVASLAARGRAFAWRQSVGGGGAATSDSGAHQLTASLMQVPKISRVLSGMTGSSILGRTWSCLRVEAINWRRRGSHIRQWHNQLTASLIQVPSEHIAGTLTSKSAGHVSEQALPHCPAPRGHIAVHMAMSLDSAARKLRLERTTRRLSRAKRSFRRRSRQYPREWTVSFAR